ncbi:transmembrane protein 241-like [Acropora millepora]|uniref:transmembrane protein 241-like n=1 Tax=Acropora millepora TaxID=45264 RepID=UPI001CF192D6|nr:transmembrane protein 241-like [Acropora millepora]
MVSTWRTRVVLVGFCCFAVITIFVNKHVLSNLHFTYPTIFQSWQTGTAALVILSMSTLGYTNLNVMSVNRTVLVSWLPASVLFSAMIYSGSVALSRLPVPVFCAIHYISIIVQILLESLLFKKDLPINSQFSLIVTALAVVMVAATDTQFDQIGYKWMMIHCTFSGLSLSSTLLLQCPNTSDQPSAVWHHSDIFEAFELIITSSLLMCLIQHLVLTWHFLFIAAAYVLYGNSLRKNSLSDLDKMFCNAVTSLILLMTISVTTGELFRIIEFPYLYSSHFHLWCMTSGLCGTALSVCHGFLLGTDLSHSIAKITSFNRVAISLLSLFIFDMSPSANMAVSIAVALFSGVLHSYSDASHREAEQLSQIEVRES